jgi:hypothetical protein
MVWNLEGRGLVSRIDEVVRDVRVMQVVGIVGG